MIKLYPMQKYQPSIGDRVKVRGYSSTSKDLDGQKGVVQCILKSGDVVINTPIGALPVKPSQCIKLVKKVKRIFWIGQVRKEMGRALWETLVAVEQEEMPTEKTTDGKQWIKARELFGVRAKNT